MRENGEAQFLTNQMWEEEIQKTKTKKKKQLEPNQENHGVQFQKNLMLKDEVKKENQCKKIDAKKKIGKKNNVTQFSTNLM